MAFLCRESVPRQTLAGFPTKGFQMNHWQPTETSAHQDGVVAHVIGATVLGYFIEDEALHLLLDIGFIWTIYLDGQMVLLPHPVAIAELDIGEPHRSDIREDIDQLLGNGDRVSLKYLSVPAVSCEIREVEFLEHGDQRQIRLLSDTGDFVIETDLELRQILVL